MEEKEKQEIKKIIQEEIEKNKPQPPEPTKIEVKPVEVTKTAVEKTSSLVQPFKSFFGTCWKGICKYMTYIMIAFYVLLTGTIIYYNLSDLSSLVDLPRILIVLIVIAEIAALGLSIFSNLAKVSFPYWVLLNIPLIMLIIVLAIQYYPIIILGLIFLTTTIRVKQQ